MIFRNPETVHNPLASYSHQVEVSSNARWLVMSAQIGMNKHGEVPENVFSQIDLALDNIFLKFRSSRNAKRRFNKANLLFCWLP